MHQRYWVLTAAFAVLLSACGTPTPRASVQKQANTAPRITSFTASKTSGPAPLTTTFSFQASDPDSNSFSCILDINGDGYGDLNYGSCASLKTQEYTFKTTGVVNVALLVEDSLGSKTKQVLPITVGSGTPTPTPDPTPTPAPTPGTSYDISYKIDNDWKSGFVATVTVKNNGPALNNWTLGWTFAGDQKISSLWNGTFTQTGQKVEVKNASYNASLPTGGTISIGFVGSYTGTNVIPTGFTLNGTPVGTPGPTPIPDPIPDPNPTPIPDPSGQWVLGYYVGYLKDKYPLDRVKWDAMTHIVVGRAVPRADGTVGTDFDIDSYNGPIWAKSVVQKAHSNGKKAILMLGGAGEYWGFVSAASDANRATFVNNLLKVVQDYGFDGIDLDWEPVQTQDEPKLKALAQELKAKKPGLLLTLPVGWANANFPADEARPYYGQIAPLFDRINIMSYSMAGVWGGWKSWHSSALFGHTPNTPSSIETSVKAYLTAGVPASKLGLGIGFYGTCWQGVTAPLQTSSTMKVVADDNVMSFTNIMSDYYSSSAYVWDDSAKAPYLTSTTGLGSQKCNFISYEDARSIGLKGQYAKQKGLGGAIIWNINEGYLPNATTSKDPLMDAVKQAFLQ
ncbi:glycosyl hydrolase family 18 protein [Deinococcus roseus]|uniref:chitinase n=1 Tax=Deinococcus roseus TaxID=392414 RepID=A0ABQ2CY94_9DEIO|nr:glycosyl hydrolase family 18 protein [Deinococcus roseus]GGJ32534.1 hypothetical protein GCM10008938_18440 [Deinococcus roseus]